MENPQSPVDIIRIESEPPVLKELIGKVTDPDQLDDVLEDLNLSASLFNIYLATPVDLSSIGLGNVVYIPVQITEREGGRKSLFYLQSGEEILAGICVTGQGIALRFVQRVTGSTFPAQTGDEYFGRITNREGEVVFQSPGTLEVIDAATGTGRINEDGPVKLDGVSFFWSGVWHKVKEDVDTSG